MPSLSPSLAHDRAAPSGLAGENARLRDLLSACASAAGGHVPPGSCLTELTEIPALIALAFRPSFQDVHSRN